jgi:putative transposase
VFPGLSLHLIQRGHNRQACFREETDYLVYLSSLAELSAAAGCALHAYCLMTNHVHLLLTPRDPEALARLTRPLGQTYVQYFNRRYSRSGTLWEGRPRTCLVDSARYVLACYRYIELNPLRAGMVGSPAEYRWSSFHGNSGRVENKALTPHPEYLALSSDVSARRRAYLEMLEAGDDAEFLLAVREATNGGLALLSEGSRSKVEAQSGRRLEHGKPGPLRAAEAADPYAGSFEF